MKKHKSQTLLSKRTIVIICVLLIAFLLIIYKSRLQIPRLNPPKKISSTEVEDTIHNIKSKLQESDLQLLVAQGLVDPAKNIVQDLMNHNELIPCKGTLGGTPGFYDPTNITILSKNYVKAVYEDGHVEGTIDFTFSVAKGKITWKVLHANCGN
jgi:hypothetical protein